MRRRILYKWMIGRLCVCTRTRETEAKQPFDSLEEAIIIAWLACPPRAILSLQSDHSSSSRFFPRGTYICVGVCVCIRMDYRAMEKRSFCKYL